MTVLVTVTAFSLVMVAAVKHHPVTPPSQKDCCKATCPKQKATDEKKPNTGLIFWDTYSTQLLQIQGVSF